VNQSLPLRDIHWPAAVDWWPLAIGWWVVIGLLLILLVVATLFFIRAWKLRRHHARIYAQQAIILDNINIIREHFQQQQNASQTCAEISALLRRVCAMYFPREQFASLYGSPWLNFLREKHAWNSNRLSLLAELPYQPQGTAKQQDVQRLLNDAEDWMMAITVAYG